MGIASTTAMGVAASLAGYPALKHLTGSCNTSKRLEDFAAPTAIASATAIGVCFVSMCGLLVGSVRAKAAGKTERADALVDAAKAATAIALSALAIASYSTADSFFNPHSASHVCNWQADAIIGIVAASTLGAGLILKLLLHYCQARAEATRGQSNPV